MDKRAAKGLSVGVIMDGNGRWAKAKGLTRTQGHKKGVDVFEDIFEYARELEISAMTFYTFSAENWARPKAEVDYLMSLFAKNIDKLKERSYENNRIIFLGDKTPFAKRLREDMTELEENSKSKTGTCLMVAVNYGGRQEILKVCKELATEAKEGRLNPKDIDMAQIERRLYTAGQPDPDFIIRTSGENRLSNFLIWQSAYSEFVNTGVFWPDFTRSDFDKAIAEFLSRNRRFGKV